jgi:hypothetical protein
MRAICLGPSLGAMLLVSVSCSSSKGTPTPPSPTVTSVTFSSSTDFLKVKETVTFAATARYSDGSSAPVTDWRSDAPSVATVDAATGKVTGVSAGMATIVATRDGMSATKPIRVVPDFAGTWKGGYTVTSCSGSTGVCRVGNVGPVEFEFSQNRENVSASIDYGLVFPGGDVYYLSGRVSGTIDTSGHLKLTGAFTDPQGGSYTFSTDRNDLYILADRVLGTFTFDMSHPSKGHETYGHTINGAGLTKVE